jgi:PmbA protein
MKELLEIGNEAVSHAQKLGADEAEIFLYSENHTSVKFVGGIFASRGGAVKGMKGLLARIAEPWIKKKGIPIITSGIRAGVGIRAVIKRAIGFSSVSSIEEKRLLEAVEEAVEIAKVRPPDPNWVSFTEPKKAPARGGIFDRRVSDLDAEEILDLCVDCCITAGDFDKRITQAMAMISAASGSFGIVNTKGVEVCDSGTFFTTYIGTKAKSGDEEVSSGDFLQSRTFTEDLRSVAISASKRAIECLGRKALPEKYVGPAVFENVSWNQLFSVIFTSGISALNVQENRSVYKGNKGKKVAKENISVVDDGTLPDGFGTTKMDDEGVPKQKTPIIEKGVLYNFLYDNYAAKREKCESTGNASRQTFFGAAAYANQPTIKPSNLTLMPGKGSLEELVSEIKHGVLVKGSLIGTHTSNRVTGDFSVTADNAFKIERGEIAYPLKPCTVAGNLYEALNSIVSIGDDLKASLTVVCPSVLIEKIVVST